MLKPVTTDIEALKILDERLRWLSAWTVHHANHIRISDDGLKVGGHQPICGLADWALENVEAIHAAQARFDAESDKAAAA